MESTPRPMKRCGCTNPTEKCPDTPRTVKPADLDPDATLVFDVRREADYLASPETIPGAMWKNPEKIDSWVNALPRTIEVVIYCCLLYTSPSPRDKRQSRMPSSA